MAWGRSVPKPPPPPRSLFMKLLPLVILIIVLGICAFIGYHIYLSVQKISNTASEKMQSKNVVFTKDGMKVGVKQIKNENYVDATQGFLVKAWNLSTWPAYKSRLWNQPEQQNNEKAQARKPYTRSSSSSSKSSKSTM
ncbi:Uncharacterized protein BP5553_09191 [Venustampulla echinocandica]|uniref:Uncharacterized protein n=1 Tax=Venustampulla echinocandica TaxID=2656787 RepID=A0A370TC11_9HELO|nr:Uncharacterized protein BP5553_09191 [Venustampulla echinocandica]RDL31789.1 Uncharacterized protein BP5553_09191 [Venustampulla echinocandica]